MDTAADAFFLEPGRPGVRLFAIHHPPRSQRCIGVVVHVHPFAEEMNKSRRMVSLQARALSAAGFAVLQVDLQGCGDSSGDFGDATWKGWVDDVLSSARWLQARYVDAPLWLWGVRAGCLLCVAAAPALASPCHFLFWQPSLDGSAVLQQFLRLRLLGGLMDGRARTTVSALKQQLSLGEPVEVAGYLMSAELALGLETAQLQPPLGSGSRLVWLEVVSGNDAAPAPLSSATIVAWRHAGYSVDTAAVAGPAFWQTSEIEDVPALIDATLRLMAHGRAR